MSKVHHIIVLKEDAGQRLDKFLSLKTVFSRSRIATLIEEGYLLPALSPDTKVKEGQTFDLTEPEAVPDEITAEKIPLNILYEDADVLVLNKDPFMVVHPGAGNMHGTLVNALLAHCGEFL